MKTMKCIKANKPDNFSHRTQWPLENFKFFMNFMVNAANVGFQEKTMGWNASPRKRVLKM